MDARKRSGGLVSSTAVPGLVKPFFIVFYFNQFDNLIIYLLEFFLIVIPFIVTIGLK